MKKTEFIHMVAQYTNLPRQAIIDVFEVGAAVAAETARGTGADGEESVQIPGFGTIIPTREIASRRRSIEFKPSRKFRRTLRGEHGDYPLPADTCY